MSKKIEVKRNVDLAEAVSIFRDIANSIKAGRVCLQKGADFLTITPEGELELEIEAKQKKDKEGISIELSWKLVEETVEEPTEDFKISATEPVVTTTEESVA